MSNPTQEPVLFPRGVADPDGRTGFCATEAGAIEAIRLDNGSLLWQSRAAIRPLIAIDSGALLATQAIVPERSSALQIVLLDVSRNGEPVLESEPILLPDWVDAGSPEAEAFRCRARLEARTLVVEWEARSRYSGGAPPTRQILQQEERNASGAVRVDLETGRVETAAAQPESFEAATLRESDAPPSSPDVVWHTEPWQADDRLATLVMKEEGPNLSLHLESRSLTGAEAAPEQVELARGTGIAPVLSPDGRYVLLEPDEPAPGPRGLQRPWWVFEAATGRRIATVPHEEGAREPCIVGPRLVYLVDEPKRPAPGTAIRTVLRARALDSGGLLWEWQLGSTRTARAAALPRGAEPPGS